jgi:hypothetical protein
MIDHEAEQEEHGDEIIERIFPHAQVIEMAGGPGYSMGGVASLDHAGNARMIETMSK